MLQFHSKPVQLANSLTRGYNICQFFFFALLRCSPISNVPLAMGWTPVRGVGKVYYQGRWGHKRSMKDTMGPKLTEVGPLNIITRRDRRCLWSQEKGGGGGGTRISLKLFQLFLSIYLWVVTEGK